MYCILIKDEYGYYSLYKIGDNIKLYSLKEDAQIDVNSMINKEKELFGDVITIYDIVIYKE